MQTEVLKVIHFPAIRHLIEDCSKKHTRVRFREKGATWVGIIEGDVLEVKAAFLRREIKSQLIDCEDVIAIPSNRLLGRLVSSTEAIRKNPVSTALNRPS